MTETGEEREWAKSVWDKPVQERACRKCGKTFQPNHFAHVYCSVECWRTENTAGGGVFAEQVKGLTDGS